MTDYMASEKQTNFIVRLVAERQIDQLPELSAGIVDNVLNGRDVYKNEAGDAITDLLAAPRKPAREEAFNDNSSPVTEPGIYKFSVNEIYQVKWNKAKTHLYTKRLVEIRGDRLNEEDDHVRIEFEYAPGQFKKLNAEMKMSAEEGKALTIRYGRCLACGRVLKNAVSVERGIGPICIKYFA